MQIMKTTAEKFRILTITLALFTLMIGAAQGATDIQPYPMPAFTLPSVKDGATVNSSAYQGKAMLISFFATWCAPCRHEIPELIKLQHEYEPKRFTVVGISIDDAGASMVSKFAQKMGINYPVLLDANLKVSQAFGTGGMVPQSFLVNREGTVIKRYIGYIDNQTLMKDLNDILK